MQVTIQGDRDGFMKMCCRNCNKDFKVNIAEYKTQETNELMCPYCGETKTMQEFLPEEVIEKAKEMAKIEFLHKFHEDLSKTLKNSKSLKVTTSKLPDKIEDPKIETKETADIKHICPNCGKSIKVNELSQSCKIHCCYCGESI